MNHGEVDRVKRLATLEVEVAQLRADLAAEWARSAALAAGLDEALVTERQLGFTHPSTPHLRALLAGTPAEALAELQALRALRDRVVEEKGYCCVVCGEAATCETAPPPRSGDWTRYCDEHAPDDATDLPWAKAVRGVL